MAEQVYFETVKEGTVLPEIKKDVSSQQLVQWAAASGDFYQIHYDKEFAIGTGLDGVIVHGALKHALLGQLLHEWIAPAGRIKRIAVQYRGMDVPGKPYWLRGRVTKTYQQDGENLVDIEISGENENGQKTTPGTATVTLPSRG